MSSRGMPKTKSMRESLRKQANERKVAYDLLSIQEKLNKLPEGHSEKQRTRLLAQLEAEKKAVPPPSKKLEESVEEQIDKKSKKSKK